LKISKEQKIKIINLNREDFDNFIKEMEVAMVFEVNERHDFELFAYDVAKRDGIKYNEDVCNGDLYQCYHDEIFYRGRIIDEFKKTKNINKFCENIKYILNSCYSIESENFEEAFKILLVRDIIIQNN